MCTAMTLASQNRDIYFGRTMDFSYPLDPELYILPKGYEWSNLLNTHKIRNKYNVIGIGQDISSVVLADGVNETGVAAAALYFPGYAQYDAASQDTRHLSIAALELVHFLLGQCASVEQVSYLLRTLRIVGTKDSVTNTVAPLHWIVADRNGKCITVEKTADALHITDNSPGVLSNSPDFGWHMSNLRNYMEVRPFQSPEAHWGGISLTPFGQGAGTFSLPGGYAPPARFVRTCFQKTHIAVLATREEAVTAGFHILEGVSIPQGIVATGRGTFDYTQYTAWISLSNQEYFFKTYDNPQIAHARLLSHHEYGQEPVSLGRLNRPVVFEQWKSKPAAGRPAFREVPAAAGPA